MLVIDNALDHPQHLGDLHLNVKFATIETVITGFVDTYPFFLRPRKTWFILLYCIIFFILGIPLTMNGGSYWLQLMDTYCGGWAILLIGMLEVVSVGWIYGRPGVRWSRPMRFQNDVEVMLGKPISKWWRFCWQWLTPALMAGIIFYSWLDYTRAKYGDKTYPVWADFLGWLMTIVSLIFVPGFIFYLIWKERRQNPYHSWRRILSDLTSPTYKWGPALPQHRLQAARQLEDSDQYYIDVVRLIKYPDYVAMHQLHQNGAADIVAQ